MSTNVSWHRQALGQLRFPPVCVMTGEPATQGVKFWFQNRFARFVPRGIASLVLWATNRPVLLTLPANDRTAAQVKKWRLMILLGLGIFALGFLLTILLSEWGALAGLFFFLGLIAAVGFAIFAQIKADVVGSNVNGDWLSMSTVHPAFADAFVKANPPGMIQVAGVRPQAQGHPQQQYQLQQQYQPQPQQAAPLPQAYGPSPGVRAAAVRAAAARVRAPAAPSAAGVRTAAAVRPAACRRPAAWAAVPAAGLPAAAVAGARHTGHATGNLPSGGGTAGGCRVTVWAWQTRRRAATMRHSRRRSLPGSTGTPG